METPRRIPPHDDALRGLQAIVESLQGISVTLDLDETLEAILDGVDSLIPYDAAAIYVVHPESRRLVASAERGYPARSGSGAPERKARRVLDRVFERGRILTSDVAAEPTYIERRRSTETEIAVPVLGSRRRPIGALIIESDVAGTYVAGSSHLLELFASGIAGAIERAVLHGEILHTRRLEQELELARRVMKGLLPRETPQLDGVETAALLNPQLDVGGDYYDFFAVGEDRWGVAIADVSGKGFAAALLMSTLRASLRSLARNEMALRSMFREANRFFRESAEEGKYATAFYGELDVAARRIIYVNAGHPPPVLVRRDGDVELLETGGVPVGLLAEGKFIEGIAELEAGDVLALYTDGITEATNLEGVPFGQERVWDRLLQDRHLRARDICEELAVAADNFAEMTELNDDRTVVVIKIR